MNLNKYCKNYNKKTYVKNNIFLYIEKPKQPAQGKILIKDLKNSTIYNETVKAIENEQKAKAAKMEDGELSDSSNDNRTPTLSPTPSRDNLFGSPTSSPSRDRKKGRRYNQTKGLVSSKNDLRLVLKEKEKKRLETIDKNKTYTENDQKDDLSHKDARDKDDKRSRSCQSQDRKRSKSRSRYSSGYSRSIGRERPRNRSREKRDRSRNDERRDSGRSRERRRQRSRSEDRSRDKHMRGRSRSKERK